jgi:hypothetical protein
LWPLHTRLQYLNLYEKWECYAACRCLLIFEMAFEHIG